MDTIHLTKAGTGKYFLFGQDIITVKATSRETYGSMLVKEVTVPSGGGPPMLHRHAYAETFYFLEGEFTVSTVDTDNYLQTLQVLPGDTLTVPSKVWHNFKNVGPKAGRFLVVHNLPVMEGLLQELGQPMEDLHQLPRPAGPLSDHQKQTMFTVLEKYMEFLPPDKVIT